MFLVQRIVCLALAAATSTSSPLSKRLEKNTMTDRKSHSNNTETTLAAFRDAWFAGKNPDPKDYRCQHAPFAKELMERIDAFLMVAEGLPALDPAANGKETCGAGEGDLGDGGETVPFVKELGIFA